MKKILFIFLLIGLVSCRDDKASKPTKQIEQNWTIEVNYLDNGVDTLYITTHRDNCNCDVDENDPYLTSSDGISVIKMRWATQASYVKSFRVLSKNEIK